MAEAAPDDLVRDEPELGIAGERERYDILILDANCKQALTSARSLGRAGLRVAIGESVGQYRFGQEPPAFRSRYCARSVGLPGYMGDSAAYLAALIAFVRDHRVRVVLPTGDEGVVQLAPHRERFAELGCTLAVASDAALDIANDKSRTLEIAAKLGIDYPKSVLVNDVADLRAAEAQFGYPYVVKPTISWSSETADRVSPVEVINETEAREAASRFLATGCQVLAQQWASGRREGVTLLMADGKVLAICAAVAHRTTPLLGGVSVMRESIAVPEDIRDASVGLATAIGLDGPSEVEWRRDKSGRPLLMEINARLAGTLENANKSGVDFPLLIWKWATGGPIQPVLSYRTGVRTRWLSGDLRWLRSNLSGAGRPDTVSAPRAVGTFLSEFARTRHYDYIDRHDMRPALAELRQTAMIIRRKLELATVGWNTADRQSRSRPSPSITASRSGLC
jgi:predicted ATP-grasp superfamily ATP-dependent carboligase